MSRHELLCVLVSLTLMSLSLATQATWGLTYWVGFVNGCSALGSLVIAVGMMKRGEN